MGKIISKNKFGLYVVGFGHNQKATPVNTDGDPSPLFLLFLFFPFISRSLAFWLSQTHH